MLAFVVTIRLVKHSVGPILLLRLYVWNGEATLTAFVVDVCVLWNILVGYLPNLNRLL